jgi:phosphoenolpyruvate synthase/pyruvate phosphate dikinase
VGSQDPWIVPLAAAADCEEQLVGGKAAKLAQLRRAGFPVPNGFCVTTRAYDRFVAETGLAKVVAMELGRKSLDDMRWEEIWDTALRIRSEFLRAEVPNAVAEAIGRALADCAGGSAVAVRSSAPGEDSRRGSFAGLHESVVGVEGGDAVCDAVRTVWASLWSDAALLYRRELSLDPLRSRMAVLIQTVTVEDCSGVAFGRDPRDPQSDCAVIEAVPGQCALLVDGSVDPDRWILYRSSGEVLQWRAGNRGSERQKPLLEEPDLENLLDTLRRVEDLFGRYGPPPGSTDHDHEPGGGRRARMVS